MIKKISIHTNSQAELVDITPQVEESINQSKVKNGICMIFVPHTTAAITINENYDSSVKEDIINILEKLIPHNDRYSHTEGNADAHIKAAIIGSSRTVLVEDGKAVFGRWQGIFFCEFDGPRRRYIYIKILPD